MTPAQINLVKASWAKVVPIKETAAELFYGRLFELDPSLKPMFKGNMVEQGKKLMMMINTVVNSLEKIDSMLPAVEDLGRRHVPYGVTDEHYDTVGSALLWTLGKGLGASFDNETRDAWASAYGILAGTMKAAAAEVVTA